VVVVSVYLSGDVLVGLAGLLALEDGAVEIEEELVVGPAQQLSDLLLALALPLLYDEGELVAFPPRQLLVAPLPPLGLVGVVLQMVLLLRVLHKFKISVMHFSVCVVCVVSCRVVSCRVVSCRVVSCRVVSCPSYVVESTPEVFVFGHLLEERARLAHVQEVHRLEEREDAIQHLPRCFKTQIKTKKEETEEV
jgi:hypothetical protein